MDNVSKEQKKEVLDFFGKQVILNVWDRALKISMDIVQQKTPNFVKMKQYEELAGLTPLQQETMCDLLSETVTDSIYRFMEMFEQNPNTMKIVVKYEGREFDLSKLSETMGSEIACFDDEGWIQKYSKIGRFVL